MTDPAHILLFSGKRKSGKDYLTEKLVEILGPAACEIVRISEPIKRFWAEQNQLSLEQLLSDGAYKESYRKQMIQWSDEQRAKDYGVFCRSAMEKRMGRPVCVVSDIRRRTDVQYFREHWPGKLILIRIECDDKVRQERGWTFQAGVDDIQSECDLDAFTEWDYLLNNGGEVKAQQLLEPLLKRLSEYH